MHERLIDSSRRYKNTCMKPKALWKKKTLVKWAVEVVYCYINIEKYSYNINFYRKFYLLQQ